MWKGKGFRSSTTTQGRKMAGARALWRANGMKEEDFKKPIIAVVNSFTQFVPGHVHLHKYGQMVKQMIEEAGGWAAEFNTIAVDDGIAMGHDGMLYSLPSREVIADSVEYMVNAHKADAMICISNCDKITPGMMMAAMRVNIPTIFVSGGPMEAGRAITSEGEMALDLVDAMVKAADDSVSDEDVKAIECAACPTCGSCSGMFTANSMNCLAEALGMAMPGNGSVLATHAERKKLFAKASTQIVEMAKKFYIEGDDSVLPRSIATYETFENAITMDIAMGGSTNTVLHLLALAQSADVDFTMDDIDRQSRVTPCLCKVAPNGPYHMEDINRAGGIMAILGELLRGGKLNPDCSTVTGLTIGELIKRNDIRGGYSDLDEDAVKRYLSAPGGKFNLEGMSQSNYYKEADKDATHGCIRDVANAYSQDGGLCVLFGNIAQKGCIVKTAGVHSSIHKFKGTARVFHSQDDAVAAILDDKIVAGDVVVILYEGPKGGPGMQEMLYPTSYLKSKHLGKACALITDGRFSGGTSGLSIGHASPEAAAGGNIGLIQDGDPIHIDIPNRSIELAISDEALAERRRKEEAKGKLAFKPVRDRQVSNALKFYGLLATSADKGAVRDASLLD